MKTTIIGGLLLAFSSSYFDHVQVEQQHRVEEEKTKVQTDYTEQDKHSEEIRRAIRRKLEVIT